MSRRRDRNLKARQKARRRDERFGPWAYGEQLRHWDEHGCMWPDYRYCAADKEDS